MQSIRNILSEFGVRHRLLIFNDLLYNYISSPISRGSYNADANHRILKLFRYINTDFKF